MKYQWILHYAGTHDENEAHLRLLLRSARRQLGEDWAWGSESEADLVMTDRMPSGDVAIQLSSSTAIATAQLVDAEDPEPAGLFLRKPFQRDAFAALLNAVARDAIARSSESCTPARVTTDPATIPAPTEPQDNPFAGNISPSSSGNASGPSTGDENILRPLLYYLPKRVLGGPARIVRDGAPPLAIDPESRMFWANGPLPALEPYVREPLRFGDWQHLSTEDLENARKSAPARPVAYLIWMDTYIQSKGVLSRRFDPEGAYRLSRRLDLANDYPRALRISAQMNQPRRLDAIARASGADLTEVYDVVNAYEAIGYLEWVRPVAAPRKT